MSRNAECGAGHFFGHKLRVPTTGGIGIRQLVRPLFHGRLCFSGIRFSFCRAVALPYNPQTLEREVVIDLLDVAGGGADQRR